MTHITDVVARSFWGNSDCDYSFSESEGLSGGILILWKASSLSVVLSFREPGYLGVKGLVDLKDKYKDGDWLIGGDFNSIKKGSERFGTSTSVNKLEWKEFSNFIEDCGLIDVPCKGKKYSWFSGDGKSKSRLDRFILDGNIVSSWGVVGQLIEQRDVSDHCPVWLIVDKEDWGPKPSKFNNEWFHNKDFMRFVEEEWKAIIVSGRGDFILKEKFRIIKGRLKWCLVNMTWKWRKGLES
ncbi:uncharacterized protein LOC131650610 [Vicia villosa]|uniref:uncharacterized protein LOC131650610 n=1 Tax=Vicia villosa TaxID=3911 RepID=UPI00273AEFFE|nr:uncharacterized protein LOC131650610 [Vicia villosa]